MEIQTLSSRFRVRRLTADDTDAIYDLSRGNLLFYQYHPPFVTRESILEDMAALPPGKEYRDKFYVGFFDSGTLAAVMDLILGFPEPEIAFIGLLMTDTRYQNQGISSQIVSDTAAHLAGLGYREIRLGVDRGNPQSSHFWTKNHFSVLREDEYILMSRTLIR